MRQSRTRSRSQPNHKREGHRVARRPKSPRTSQHAAPVASAGRPSITRDELLVGRHPVLEALRAGRTMTKLWVQDDQGTGSLREIVALARAHRIPVVEVPWAHLEELAGASPHQGVVAQVAAKEMLDLNELLTLVEKASEPLVYLLDGIQDPQNLGAILRSADAIGATAVVLPERGAVGLTSAVAKASAGAIEYVSVARVTNLAQTMDRLKALGLFIYAADPAAEMLYTAVDWSGGIGVVIGGEGAGVRPIVRQRADGVVKLPMLGHVSSLNASSAAAVIGFEIIRQRWHKKSVLTRV